MPAPECAFRPHSCQVRLLLAAPELAQPFLDDLTRAAVAMECTEHYEGIEASQEFLKAKGLRGLFATWHV